jgi:hypothetical protein
MAIFKVFSLHLPVGTEEHYKKPQSGQLMGTYPNLRNVTTMAVCSVSLVYFTYVLQMLQPTEVSFHPYPDDPLLPLVQVEYSQPVNSGSTNKTGIKPKPQFTVSAASTQLQCEAPPHIVKCL